MGNHTWTRNRFDELRERAQRRQQMALLRLYFVRVSLGFCAIAVVATLIVHLWNRL